MAEEMISTPGMEMNNLHVATLKTRTHQSNNRSARVL